MSSTPTPKTTVSPIVTSSRINPVHAVVNITEHLRQHGTAHNDEDDGMRSRNHSTDEHHTHDIIIVTNNSASSASSSAMMNLFALPPSANDRFHNSSDNNINNDDYIQSDNDEDLKVEKQMMIEEEKEKQESHHQKQPNEKNPQQESTQQPGPQSFDSQLPRAFFSFPPSPLTFFEVSKNLAPQFLAAFINIVLYFLGGNLITASVGRHYDTLTLAAIGGSVALNNILGYSFASGFSGALDTLCSSSFGRLKAKCEKNRQKIMKIKMKTGNHQIGAAAKSDTGNDKNSSTSSLINYASRRDIEEIGEMAILAIGTISVLLIPFTLLFWNSAPIVRVIFGEEYVPLAATYLQYAIPNLYCATFANALSRCCQAQQRADIPAVATILSTVVSVLTSIFVVPHFGVGGVAFAITMNSVVIFVSIPILAYLDTCLFVRQRFVIMEEVFSSKEHNYGKRRAAGKSSASNTTSAAISNDDEDDADDLGQEVDDEDDDDESEEMQQKEDKVKKIHKINSEDGDEQQQENQLGEEEEKQEEHDTNPNDAKSQHSENSPTLSNDINNNSDKNNIKEETKSSKTSSSTIKPELLVFRVSWFRPNIRKIFTPDRIKEFLRVGASCAAQVCSEWLSFEVWMVISAGLGTEGFAAFQIFMSTTVMVFSLAASVGVAASSQVGGLLGEKKPLAAFCHAKATILWSAVLALTASSIVYVFHETIFGLYTSDAAVIGHLKNILGIFFVFVLLDHQQFVTQAALYRGTGRNEDAPKLSIGALWFIGLPLSYFGSKYYDLFGLLGGFIIGELVLLPLLWRKANSFDWNELAEKASREGGIVGGGH